MLIAPLIALLLVLASSASHAQCQPNSWDYQPNIAGSDLESSDFDWLREDRRFSKQKFGFDLTSITSKRDMEIVKAAAVSIWRVDSIGNMHRPRPQGATDLLKKITTQRGFETIENQEIFPRLGPIGYCHLNFKAMDESSFSIDVYYGIEGLRYGNKPGSPIKTRRLVFIKQDGEWLFDRLGDNSDLPKLRQ